MPIDKNQPFQIPLVPEKEIRERHQKLRSIMAERNLDALLIAGGLINYCSGGSYLRYICNYAPHYGDEYIIFPREGRSILYLWGGISKKGGHYMSAVQVASGVTVVEVARQARPGLMAQRIRELKADKGRIGVAGVEYLPGDIYLALKKELPKAKFIPASDLLVDLMLVKSDSELNFVRKAGKLADDACAAMVKTVRPGVKECEVYAAIDHAIISGGGTAPSFILTCSGPAPIFPRSPASHRRLRKGDTFLNEITPIYGGYAVQFCRQITLGRPKKKVMELYKVAQEVYQMMKEELRPGPTFAQVHKKASDYIKSFGYTSTAPTLQLSGMDITEAFRVKSPLEVTLKPGMVVVNHPHVVAGDRSAAALMGDTYIITKGKPQPTSKSPLDYIVI